MVYVDPDARVIFVRGLVRHEAIEAAVCRALGVKTWRNRKGWVIAAVPTEESTEMARLTEFAPPEVEHEPIGFKIHGKGKT